MPEGGKNSLPLDVRWVRALAIAVLVAAALAPAAGASVPGARLARRPLPR
jgi:hypothetical protein